MTAPPGAATRVFALLGDPVAHSLSPAFQNAALRAAGLDGVYVALRAGPDELPGLLRGLALAGGGGNVTVPHKALAATCLDEATEAVRATGACNTFWSENGRVHGDNTDVEGVRAAVAGLLGKRVPRAVVMAGAGGAARAAVAALRSLGCEDLVVLNRSAARAMDLRADFAGGAPRIRIVPPDAELGGARFDLAINATSLGLRARDPLPSTGGAEFGHALDLVYAAGGETPWVRSLRDRGILAEDGARVLLHQGAAAFRRWWGTEPPLEAMHAALTAPDPRAQPCPT